MRKLLLYFSVAALTVLISLIVHVIQFGNPYRFQYAALTGDSATIDTLLAQGTPVDLRDDSGDTALTYAAGGGYTVIVKRLLSAGADVNAHDQAGFTPLISAADKGHLEIIDILLKAGADVNSTQYGRANRFDERRR